MFQELLREIGLTPNEAKVYEALLYLGETTTNQLTLKSKVHRSNVYDALNKLAEKGMASEIFMKGEKRFKAVHPNRLLEIEKEKELKIQKAIPKMEKLFSSFKEKETAKLYKGINGVKNYLQDVLDTKETVYVIGAKAFWLDPRLKYMMLKFRRESKRLGIKFRHLFDHEIRTQKRDILKLAGRLGKDYKFLPKDYSSPTAIDIFGDYVVTFVGVKPGQLEAEPVQFVMKSKKLAEGYKKLFECLWNECAEK